MDWQTLLDSLPSTEAQRLVDQLTAGYGALTFAARLMTRNGRLTEIVVYLRRAEAMLASARVALALAEGLEPPVVMPSLARPRPPPLTWTAYVAAIPPAESRAQIDRVLQIVALTRRSGERIAANGAVREIGEDLRQAVSGLAQVRRALQEISARLERDVEDK